MEPGPRKARQGAAKRSRLSPRSPSQESRSPSEGGGAEGAELADPGVSGRPSSSSADKAQRAGPDEAQRAGPDEAQRAGPDESLSQESQQAMLLSLEAAFEALGQKMERMVTEQSERWLELFHDSAGQLLASGRAAASGERQEGARLMRVHRQSLAQRLRAQDRHVLALRRLCREHLERLEAAVAADTDAGPASLSVARGLSAMMASLEEKVVSESERRAAVLTTLLDELDAEL